MRSSTFLTFLEESVDKDHTQYITKDNLREAYNIYCEQHQVATESDRAIGFKMSDKGITDKQKTVDGMMTRVWTGIKLKNPIATEELKQDEVSFKL
jgi:hypothetical protein